MVVGNGLLGCQHELGVGGDRFARAVCTAAGLVGRAPCLLPAARQICSLFPFDIVDSIRRAYDLNAKILLEINRARQDCDFAGDKYVGRSRLIQ